jgi:hypothetical protein
VPVAAEFLIGLVAEKRGRHQDAELPVTGARDPARQFVYADARRSRSGVLGVEFGPNGCGFCPIEARNPPGTERNPFEINASLEGPWRARSEARQLMASRSTINLAVVLAALLFFSASGLCAAFLPQVSQPTHPCCPNHSAPSRDASVPPCCIATGGPVIPAPVSSPGRVNWSTSAATSADQTQPRASEGVAVEQRFSDFSPLYLQFHQLLI